MEGEEESSLDVTGDDIDLGYEERPVNRYGSPVALPESTDHEEAGPSQVLPSRVICQCKNTCSRKTGKYRGCVCRDAGLRCSASCVCGSISKPCKNNKEVVINQRQSPPSSAFERHQIALEKERESVQTFIESLSNSQRERLLLDVLCNGRGSLDYAKQLVANSEDPNPDTPANTNCPNWCICNVCMDMGNEEENKCCKNRSCVTSYELFRNIVLDREVLTIAIRARCDIRAENADYEMNSFRKAAYRQFILWKYGKLGKSNRRVCPSCVVRLVRQTYPALDGQYMGFRRH